MRPVPPSGVTKGVPTPSRVMDGAMLSGRRKEAYANEADDAAALRISLDDWRREPEFAKAARAEGTAVVEVEVARASKEVQVEKGEVGEAADAANRLLRTSTEAFTSVPQ